MEMSERFGVCKSLNSPPHITLIPPFRFSQDEEKLLCKLANQHYRGDLRAVSDDISHFDDRVIFVNVRDDDLLEKVKEKLELTLMIENIRAKKSKRFHQHITIGYRNLSIIFDKAWEHFKNLKVDDHFTLNGPKVLRHNGAKWEIIS